jgi:hypothetical protein
VVWCGVLVVVEARVGNGGVGCGAAFCGLLRTVAAEECAACGITSPGLSDNLQ